MSLADELIAKAKEAAAASKDPSKHAHEAPSGYRLRGVSTLLDAEGNVKQQWVKTAPENDNAQAFLDAFALAVEAREIPRAPVVEYSQPSQNRDDLLTVYPWGDPHIGMLSWHMETGTDFDLDIARNTMTLAVRRLVGLAPASRRCAIINLGDFFHSDDMEARTRRSGHHLDVDGRWSKILQVGIAIEVECIDLALEKHEEVEVFNQIGNHDDMSSVMLSICIAHHYRDNPRVKVRTSPAMFHFLEFGKCLVGVTHGHTVKANDLPGIMAYDQAASWGRTAHRYWYTGHVHHQSVKEYPGCIVETFRTLAARDAWHHASGYRAGRSMVCDVLHRERGRILRHEVGIESLEVA